MGRQGSLTVTWRRTVRGRGGPGRWDAAVRLAGFLFFLSYLPREHRWRIVPRVFASRRSRFASHDSVINAQLLLLLLLQDSINLEQLVLNKHRVLVVLRSLFLVSETGVRANTFEEHAGRNALKVKKIYIYKCDFQGDHKARTQLHGSLTRLNGKH